MLFLCSKSHSCLISIWSLVFSPSFFMRLPMPYSPSSFISSYSLGIVLVEHEAPFALIPFFQSSLQILLQMHWVSTRLPMPYSPSLFFSSYSLGIVLVEHEAPYAIPLISMFSSYLLFYLLTFLLLYCTVYLKKKNKKKPKKKQKPKKQNQKTKPKKKNSKPPMPGCKSWRQKREHCKINCLVYYGQIDSFSLFKPNIRG